VKFICIWEIEGYYLLGKAGLSYLIKGSSVSDELLLLVLPKRPDGK
jgi:hypothetical protein